MKVALFVVGYSSDSAGEVKGPTPGRCAYGVGLNRDCHFLEAISSAVYHHGLAATLVNKGITFNLGGKTLAAFCLMRLFPPPVIPR